MAGNVLTISGEKKEEHEEKSGRFYAAQRQFGSFSRSFVLPADVKEERIEAGCKGGALTVKIPKMETCHARLK